MAGSHSTPSHAVIVSPYANEEPMRHLRPASGAAVRRNRARRTWARAQSGAEHGRRHGAGNDRSGARTGQSQHAARANPGTEVNSQRSPPQTRETVGPNP